MTATTISAADKAAVIRALDGVLPEMHAKALHDYLFTTLPALISSDIGNVIQGVADNAAVKALDVTTLADKAIVYVEGTGLFYAYDSTSVAAEALGPPATVIAPTTGAGRYLVVIGTTAYVDARVRACADQAAIKALTVANLVNGAVILKIDTLEVFIYVAASGATEILGPPALVIAPTVGAGRFINTAAVEKRLRVCADAAAMKALVVGGLLDKALIYKEDTNQLLAYDADSAAAEFLGPPARVIQPTAGAGRYISLTLGDAQNRVHKFDATVDPTITDDSTPAGYGAGSLWVNVTDGTVFQCVDPTNGAAVWKQLSPSATPHRGDGKDGVLAFDGTNSFKSGSAWQVANSAAGGEGSLTTEMGAAPNLVYTLIREPLATSIHVSTGITVHSGNFPLRGTGDVLIDGTVTINGKVGAAGGQAIAAGTLAAGSDGGADKVGAGAGNTGANITSVVGGIGGAGGGDDGTPGTNAGGAAGTVAAPTAGSIRALPAVLNGSLVIAGVVVAARAGSGGGSGGAAAGSTGGCGGGGGGGLPICARKITISATGVVQADGGAGKSGSGAAGGGGGGGGGGWVALVADVISNLGSVTAAGGAGGAGAGSGIAGAAGTAGKVIQIHA